MTIGLDDLTAELGIRRAIYRYCRGVNRGDVAMIASAYHDDADENHGAFKGTGRQFAEYLVPLMDKISVEWRSGRDSNPRYAFGVYSLSRRAPSTTRPPLRMPFSGVRPNRDLGR